MHRFLLFFLLSPILLIAQLSSEQFDSKLDISNAIHYKLEDGLPSDKVYGIEQDEEGYIWLATEAGLSRFNGQHFSTYTTKDGLKKNDIIGISKSESNLIWIANHGAIGFIKNGTFQFIDHKFDQILVWNYNMVEIESKAFISDLNTIYLIDIEKKNIIDQKILNSNSNVAAYIIGKYKDKIIVQIASFVYSLKLEELFDEKRTYENGIALPSLKKETRASRSITIQKDSLLYHYKQGQLFSINLKTTKTKKLVEGLGKVINIIRIKNTFYLPLTSYGIVVFDVDENDELVGPIRTMYEDQQITDVFEDFDGNIWMSSYYNGIYFFPKKKKGVLSYNVNSLNAVYVHGDSIWLGNQKGELSLLYNNEIQNFKLPHENLYGVTRIIDIKKFDANTLVLSTDVGLYLFRAGKFSLIIRTAAKKITIKHKKIIFNTYKGSYEISFSCLESIFKNNKYHSDETFEQVNCIKNIFDKRTYASTIDDDDNYYISNISTGLTKVNPEGIKSIYKYSENNNTEINDLSIWKDQVVVATNGSGISFVDLHNKDKITYVEGLNSQVTNTIAHNKNSIFVGTNKGLNILTPSSKMEKFHIQSFTTTHGLLNNEIRDLYVQNDQLYVVSNGGLNILDLKELQTNRKTPNLKIEDIFINQIKTDFKENYLLEANENNILIKYNKIDFARSDNSTYAYKLKGYEEAFNYTNSTEINYPNLPSGLYTFQIGITDRLSIKPEKLQEISFEIKVSFLQSIWAKILAAILFFGLTYLILYSYFSKGHLKALSQKVEERTLELNNKVVEINEINSQLEVTNKNLSKSNEELERFAHIASHDLKQPLNNIIAFSSLLERSMINEDEKKKMYLGFITKGAKRMNTLIKDVLEYSSINQAKSIQRDVDLNLVVQEIKESILTELTAKNAMINVENELPTIWGVKTRLFLVFKNLIENGIKYNRSEFPIVTINYQKDASFHQIAFSDNGIGIDEKYFPKLFVMFSRLENHKDFEGTGLGLSLCKKIIENLDGKIELNSELGKGSTFTVYIPIQENTDQ